MKRLFLILMFSGVLTAQGFAASLLLETERFDPGGWVVDPQFVEQMGSPYLLAHGLGRPVENAAMQFKVAKAGVYHIWARTLNWVPGSWDAPGRFRVIVDGRELDMDLGTRETWGWQYVGTARLNQSQHLIELRDLTGFEGRCDALYLSRNKKAPPDSGDSLRYWRAARLGESSNQIETETFDLVVTGGGIAGCAAAVAAAQQGLQVALIHDRPVLGGNASSEIRVHTLGLTWRYDDILKHLNTSHYPNGSPQAQQADEKRMQYMRSFPNIALFLNWRAFTTKSDDSRIIHTDARHTHSGKRRRFKAPLFADCTGDGWIGYWSGAEYMYGREDSSRFHERWPQHDELWSPAESDNRVMGSSLLWRSIENETASKFLSVPWAMPVAGDHAAVNGEWYWEFSRDDLHQIRDAEKIRDHMFRAIYGSFYNAKQLPENANRELEWISYLLGKRESRRLKGDYIYTFNDMRKSRTFPDAVVREKRDIDVHYQNILLDPTRPDFLSTALFYPVEFYYVPYRCLYSKNIENLFMAGRCFSGSHIGLGGPRVMNTTGQMGAAVGYAASLCVKHKTVPRQIYEQHLQELLDLINPQK
ncbi:MAG: FAD-dependent oxidoreductase [candidate division KSB1 bacterium]|nr:FAD-dependent oxidoreductase [candidate division KSB1 bacterium]